MTQPEAQTGATHTLASTAFTCQADAPITEKSDQGCSLWDEAYDNLKKDPGSGKLVLQYEEILVTKCPDITASPAHDGGSESNISADPAARDAQMRAIMAFSVSRTEKLRAAVEAG
jgi:N-terminal domain of NWD NACHT-NTPase